MDFGVYGAFPVKVKTRKVTRQGERVVRGKVDPEFWKQVDSGKKCSGLSDAHGVYVFAIRNGDNFKPWYVGMTESSFKERVFGKRWLKELSEIKGGKKGLYVFLIAALTKTGRFRKRTSPTQEIKDLEFMLIGMALRKNRGIFNISGAEKLLKMNVPGVTNIRSKKGRLSQGVKDLQNALGITP